MGYYYITVYWDFLNSVQHSRIVPVAARNLEEAMQKAKEIVSQQWGRFNVHVQGIKLVS